ncbi:MAG: 7TM-DISM domain-containing protein [Cyclobacteriaceae bacterium]
MNVVIRFYLFILFSALSHLAQADPEPKAANGEMDLRQWNFAEQSALRLSGQWQFYLNQLVDPTEIKKEGALKNLIDFPSTWNGISDSHNSGIGYATYQLRIILPNHSNPLALELPDFYCSYKLWINEKLIAKNGEVATTAEQSKPQWLPQTVVFQPTADTLDIVIHVSNFDHYKGGIREPIYIGAVDQMQARRNSFVISNSILCVVLLLMSLTFLLIYFIGKKNISMSYFAIICLAWGIRSVFSNNYLFISLFPDFPWHIAVRIEYLTLYFTMIYAMLFLGSIFKDDVNFLVKYALIGGNLIFAFTTLFSPTVFFTQLLPIYLSFCAVLILYAIFVVLRALVYDRKGVWFVIASILLGILIFGVDLLAYQGLAPFNALIFYIGYLIMFSLNCLCLLYVSGFIFKSKKDESIMRFEDYFGKNK